MDQQEMYKEKITRMVEFVKRDEFSLKSGCIELEKLSKKFRNEFPQYTDEDQTLDDLLDRAQHLVDEHHTGVKVLLIMVQLAKLSINEKSDASSNEDLETSNLRLNAPFYIVGCTEAFSHYIGAVKIDAVKPDEIVECIKWLKWIAQSMEEMPSAGLSELEDVKNEVDFYLFMNHCFAFLQAYELRKQVFRDAHNKLQPRWDLPELQTYENFISLKRIERNMSNDEDLQPDSGPRRPP